MYICTLLGLGVKLIVIVLVMQSLCLPTITNSSRFTAYCNATDIDHKMTLVAAATCSGCCTGFSGELREMRIVTSFSQ